MRVHLPPESGTVAGEAPSAGVCSGLGLVLGEVVSWPPRAQAAAVQTWEVSL